MAVVEPVSYTHLDVYKRQVVYAVVITITRPLLGIVFDMKGENFVLYPCFVSLALGIFLLSIAHSTWLVLLSAVFVGLGYGTFMSNGQAVTVKIVPCLLYTSRCV